ncbi:MAG: hypothetical protein ABWX84_06010 [Nocardioides sp.]
MDVLLVGGGWSDVRACDMFGGSCADVLMGFFVRALLVTLLGRELSGAR